MRLIPDSSVLREAGTRQTLASILVLVGMVVVIGSALGFEHIGGYAPCALCLEQRVPYYWGIPIAAVGSTAALFAGPAWLTRGLLAVVTLCLLITAYLGVYHSGVEWGFFAAPESCGAGLSATSSDASNLLESLSIAKPPSCADAAGRFLGLSFAGWNVVAAGILAAIAFRGATGPAKLN
ncbi:MAG: disulfide bond formation protein B [Rhizobiaceae bacterium]|nr:disulfide bond formation protein B [Hyphomicrobiales bacterium]NRB29844.1 disulfide bond formation protein B [Rhizobiaceae bacterium]